MKLVKRPKWKRALILPITFVHYLKICKSIKMAFDLSVLSVTL